MSKNFRDWITPSKAGVHTSSAQQADKWIPAFAGKRSGGGFIEGGSAARPVANSQYLA
jgi:hypothetical protein